MSTAHVFVGQCGNQLGTAFLDALAAEAEASKDEEYQRRVSAQHFRPAMRAPPPSHARRAAAGQQQRGLFDSTAPLSRLPQPRCVMVDMEPKVIEEAIRRVNGAADPTASLDDSAQAENPHHSFYCLAPQQCVTRGEGSANNWAYGYYQQGQSRREAIAECLRRESEAREGGAAITAYHVVHSVAGGTGSGVGCLVAEVVRELYPHAALMHSLVWPFAGGEVATQWYNTVLCLSNLKDTADAICVAYNDAVAERLMRAQKIAAKGGAQRGPETSVTYDEMNRQIGRLWAALHLPQLLFSVPPPARDPLRHRIQSDGAAPRANHGALPAPQRFACCEDIIEAMAIDPAQKIFTGLSVPYHAVVRERMAGSAGGTSSWPAVLADAARTSHEAFATSGTMGLSGGGALWLLRGRAGQTEGLRALREVLAAEPRHALRALFVSPDGGRASTSSPTAALTDGRPTHEVAMFGHSPLIPATLKVALERAEKQLQAGAYTHQFERFGVDKDTLQDCTMRLWDTVYAYSGEC